MNSKNIFQQFKSRLRSTLLPLFLFISAFSINFYRASEIHGMEDFYDSNSVIKFIESFNIRYLMNDHHNSMEFPALPFYMFFEFDISTLRLMQAFFLSGSIVLFFFFSKNYFNDRKKALLSTLLLISFPYFILHRYYSEYSFLAFITTGCLFFYSLILKKEDNDKYIFILGLLIGIGTYRKIIFAPFGLFLILSYVLINPRRFKKRFLSIKKSLVLLGATVMGALPLIIWEFYMVFYSQYYGITENILNLFKEGAHSDYLTKLIHRFGDMENIFTTFPQLHGNPGGFSAMVGFFSFYLFLFSAFFLFLKKDKKSGTFILLILLYTAASTFEMQMMLTFHLMILIPLFVVILVHGTFEFFESISKNKIVTRVTPSLLITFIIIFNLFNIFEVKYLEENFSSGRYSTFYRLGSSLSVGGFDSIYNFVDPWACDVCGVAGISLYFLSEGVPQKNVFEALRTEDKAYFSARNPEWERRELRAIKFEDVIESSANKNNVYFDLIVTDSEKALVSDYEKGQSFFQERVFNIDFVEEYLSENGYGSIRIEDQERGVAYLVWVHKNNERVIEKLQNINS